MQIPVKFTAKMAGIILLASSPLPVVFASSASAATETTASAEQLLASAPCIVTGYSLHASEEMAVDSIGSDEVENLVYSGCSSAKWQKKKKTWKYQNRKLVVIANSNGYIVSAWRL